MRRACYVNTITRITQNHMNNLYTPAMLRPAAVPEALRVADVARVLNVQHACYAPELHEERDVFESIVRCGMSRVVCAEGGIVGYALVHGIADPDDPPGLNAAVMMQQHQDHVFIHDVAVHPDHRGKGRVSARRCRLRLRRASRRSWSRTS